MAGIDNYRMGLRFAVRGLWTGVIDRDQFDEQMRVLINRRLKQAFDEGAAECGIKPDEFTEEENLALVQTILEELEHIDELAQRVEENSKKNKGKLTPLLTRVSTLWVNKYNDFVNLGKQQVCGDEKLIWNLGSTKEHCRDCLNYNGRVYRASVWKRNKIKPQSKRLFCRGFRCLCELKPTNLPVTKGRVPAPTF